MLQTILGIITGGGTFLLSLLGSIAPGLATAIGGVFVQYKQTQAAREGAQDASGVVVATSWFQSVHDANVIRAQARKDEGAWGPLGLITFAIGAAFVYHVWQIVGDSSPFHPVLTTKFFVVPWLGWESHVVGSWGVAALPGKFQDVELAALQALFYVAPPAAAAIAVAKVFRR